MADDVTMIPASPQDVEFGSFRSPDSSLKEAQMVATAFQRKAIALQLYQPIGESKHLKIEGWQMLAAMYRVTASIESTRYVEFGDAHGWEATAVAIHVPTGREISRADAMCLDDEDKWGAVSKYEWQPNDQGEKVKVKVGDVRKPLQQLRSMAQTRAQSKVLSNLLKWVAKMAGFAGTPAEEMMPGQESESGGAQQHQEPRTAGGGPVITEPQSKRLFSIFKGSGRSKDEYTYILKHFGFANDREVTKAKYEEVCNAVQNPQWKPAEPAPPVSQPRSAQQQEQAPPANGGTAKPSDDTSLLMWREIVNAWGGEAKAVQALANMGFERWAQVNVSDRAKVATALIEEANKLKKSAKEDW